MSWRQVSVAVLLDNFLTASKDIKKEEEAAYFEERRKAVPVGTPSPSESLSVCLSPGTARRDPGRRCRWAPGASIGRAGTMRAKEEGG